MDWSIWTPGQTSISAMGRDKAAAQDNAKAPIKELRIPRIVSDRGKDFMACSMVSTTPSALPAAHDLDGILIQPLHWDIPDVGVEKRVTRKPTR